MSNPSSDIDVMRIVIGATITWATWKVLQGVMGHRIDNRIADAHSTRQVRKTEVNAARVRPEYAPEVRTLSNPSFNGFDRIR